MDKRKFAYIFTFCLLFFSTQIVGFFISNYGKINYNPLIIIVCFLVAILLSVLITLTIVKVKFFSLALKDYPNINKILSNKYFLFMLIFLSFLPAFLAYFPSIWSYDIATQLDQIFNSGYTRYHPLLHTLMIDICLRIGNFIFNSYTIGAMLYSLIQMGLLSICITYALIYVFNEFHLSTFKKIMIVLFYTILPFNAIMAISTTKDTIFAGLTLVVVIKFFDIFKRKYNIIDIIKFLLILLLWFAFRNNAYFAYIAFSILMIILFWKNKKTIIIGMAIIIVSNSLFNYCLDIILKAETISTAEIISVPGSQIAKAAIYDADKFNNDENQLLEEVFGKSYLNYNPYLFDDVKSEMNFSIDKLPKLLMLWIKLLPKSLPDYIDAFLCLNIGSWYLLDETYTRIYIDNFYNGEIIKGNLTDRHQGYLQTYQSDVLNINFRNYFPSAYNYYEKICSMNVGQNYIITKLLLSPATYLWTIIGLLFYFIYKKDKNKTIPIILLILYWCTTLLGPCTLFRYMYPIVISTPICLCFVSNSNKNEC